MLLRYHPACGKLRRLISAHHHARSLDNGRNPVERYWAKPFAPPSEAHSVQHTLPQSHRLRLSERNPLNVLLFLTGLSNMRALYAANSALSSPRTVKNRVPAPQKAFALFPLTLVYWGQFPMLPFEPLDGLANQNDHLAVGRTPLKGRQGMELVKQLTLNADRITLYRHKSMISRTQFGYILYPCFILYPNRAIMFKMNALCVHSASIF